MKILLGRLRLPTGQNLPIRYKMGMLGVFVVLGFITIIILGSTVIEKVRIGGELYKEIEQAHEFLEMMAQQKSDLNQVRAELGFLIGVDNPDVVQSVLQRIEPLAEEVNDRFENMLARITNEEKELALLDAQKTWRGFYEAIDKYILPAVNGGNQRLVQTLIKRGQQRRFERFNEQVSMQVDLVRLEIQEMKENTAALISRLTFVNTGVGATVAFLTVILTLLIARSLAGRVLRLSTFAKVLADGDLRELEGHDPELSGKDEIGDLDRSLTHMATQMKALLVHLQDLTGSLTDATTQVVGISNEVVTASGKQRQAIDSTSKNMNDMDESITSITTSTQSLSSATVQTSTSVVEINHSIGDVAEMAETFSAESEEAAATVEENAVSVREISENVSRLQDSSQSITQSMSEIETSVQHVLESASDSVKLAERVTDEATNKGSRSIEAARAGMSEISDSARGLDEVITGLGKSSERIGVATEVIESVADQTSLLALNASIIAAQSGTSGRAFSIIAEEIKELASRTVQSTQEINDVVSTVRTSVKDCVKMVQVLLNRAGKGDELIEKVGNAIDSVLDSSKSAFEKAESIQVSAYEEATLIGQVARSAEEMSNQVQMIGQATVELSDKSNYILTSLQKIREMASQVRNATGEQASGVEQVSSAVNEVSSQMESIASASRQQKSQSEEVVRLMSESKTITEEFDRLSENLKSIIATLDENSQTLVSAFEQIQL